MEWNHRSKLTFGDYLMQTGININANIGKLWVFILVLTNFSEFSQLQEFRTIIVTLILEMRLREVSHSPKVTQLVRGRAGNLNPGRVTPSILHPPVSCPLVKWLRRMFTECCRENFWLLPIIKCYPAHCLFLFLYPAISKKWYFYPHFLDENTESQRSQVTFPRFHNW